ncbi:translation initiation factor 2 [Paenibacillus sp. GCM10027627]|uniref:translation initiation factor 2 n=1 Tax=unclassified Paenibacillus TaxID=185978 RepID=UPI00362EF2D3
MRRNPWKWLAIGGAITFLVLFGMEMTSTGIERIYGPIEGGEGSQSVDGLEGAGAPEKQSDTEKRIAELERELADIRKLAYSDEQISETEHPRLPGVPFAEEEAAVNKLADSTSGLLESASNTGIRFVVSLFDGWMN